MGTPPPPQGPGMWGPGGQWIPFGQPPPAPTGTSAPPAAPPPAAPPPAAPPPTGGAIGAASAQTATGFARFNQIMDALKTAQLASTPAKLLSGWMWATLVMEALVLANTGNPGLFYGKSDEWEQISKNVGSIWTDLTDSYNTQIPPYWQGDAQKAMDTYVNKTLQSAQTDLKALCDQLPVAMTALGNSVLAVDITALVFTIASAVFLDVLAAAVVATLGGAEPALMSAVVAYLVGLAGWLAAVALLFQQAAAQLTPLQQKANDLVDALYRQGDASQGSRLTIDPALVDPGNANNNYWTFNPSLR